MEGSSLFRFFLIGLSDTQFSGTSGYVVRNLSSLRVHERSNDKSAWEAAPPKHREPDQAILEHERKRKVEIKCLELRDELEEKEYPFIYIFLASPFAERTLGLTKIKSTSKLTNFAKSC